MRNTPQKWQITALFLIIVLAAFFRFYLITDIPPGLYPDEAANGNDAVEALRTGNFKIFYPENNGREGLFINLQAIAITLLGPDPWVLRIVSALCGTLTVLGIYLAAKELFRESRSTAKGAALLSAFFLTTSFWHINFSRIGFRAILVPFFAVFGMYWLLKALRTGKISSALGAGIAIGLGFYTYIGYRFMPFAFAVPIVLALIAWRRQKSEICTPCIAALIIFIAFVTALPLGMHFVNNPGDFFGRSGQVSIFSADSPLREFAKSNMLTLGMLVIRGDCNPRHNLACRPELFWPVGMLFLIGLAITVRNPFRKPRSLASYTLAAWFLFMMLPATLTREGLPHALRAIGMLPPIMILAGLGGAALWQAISTYVQRASADPKYAANRGQLARIRKELLITGILFLLWLPVQTYRDYFIRFAYSPATADAFANDLWEQGRYLAKLPDGIRKFVIVNLPGEDIRGVPAPAQTIMFATDTFEEARRRERGITYVTRIEDIRIDPASSGIDAGAKVAIIPLNPRDRDVVAALRRRFPFLKSRVIDDVVAFEYSGGR